MNPAAQSSVTTRPESRIGKRPITVPKGVTVGVSDGRVKVEGPKGKLAMDVPKSVQLTREGDIIRVASDAPGRAAARLQGLARALLASMVKGAAEGYTETLELVGTGYRCEVQGKTVKLQLGLSHVAVYQLPESVSGVVPADSKSTVLVLTSPNKALLGQASAAIRHLRPPEPYGGKGVRVRGEKVRHKAGKAGKGRTK
jgi:large subunit ribosomal protein L6